MSRPGIDTFTISAAGGSITCKRCKRTSHNPNDVRQRYCAVCGVFHEDLWPPVREWWVSHPEREAPRREPWELR